ncbi:MAG: Fe(3+) ABC transporter substrate-binding protein [Gammaproteobacteria bacterium]
MKTALMLATCTSLILTGCDAPGEEVSVYSAREEQLIKPLLDNFSEQTGIQVNLVTGDADELLQRLASEGRNTPADVLITTDAGRLHRARTKDLLQPVQSRILDNAIPANYRDPDDYWFGLSMRARPIMYARGRVDRAQLSTYEALADKRWHKEICIRTSSNIYNQSLVASMIASLGEKRTGRWARRFVNNFARKPTDGDRDQIEAVAAGVCDIAIANTYYLGQMLNDANPGQREAAAKVAIFWPNQDGRGTHVNISGAGVTKAAQHQENAVKLLEFLVGDQAQRWYAQANQEYPVKPGIAASETLRSWGDFKADDLNLSRLGELNAKAVKLMDRVGWP